MKKTTTRQKRLKHNEAYYLTKARSATTYKSKAHWYALADTARTQKNDTKPAYVEHCWENEQNMGCRIVGFSNQWLAKEYISRNKRVKPYGYDTFKLLSSNAIKKIPYRKIEWYK